MTLENCQGPLALSDSHFQDNNLSVEVLQKPLNTLFLTLVEFLKYGDGLCTLAP